jgi:ribosomal protein S27AE
MAGRECPRCGREQPETATGGKCLFCGADLPWVAATLPSPPAEHEQPADGVEPGKRPCPRCGESLYATEKRCWRCGYEFEETPEAPAEPAPPAEAPVMPPPPVAAAPPPVVPSPVPYYPTTVAPPPPEANKQAQVLGIWSLVTGLLGIFCCFGFAAIAAIYLGVRSNRLAKNGLATGGIVLGVVGIFELLALVALGLFGYFIERTQSVDTSALAPVLHYAVAIARPLLGL